VPLDYDPDLHRLAEGGQVEDAVDGLLECADGLDDEVVQAGPSSSTTPAI
jgi:hypothetical protein